MKILLLGGTAMLGRAITAAAADRGHAVTCLARGSSPAPEGSTLFVADRDEIDGLTPVSSGEWNAIIDLSRQPGQVRRAVAQLDAQHWVFVSSNNATDPSVPLHEVIAAAKQVAKSSATPQPVSAPALAELEIGSWMGPASLPLWIDDPGWRGFATLNTERARAAGLVTRPLDDTLCAALDYENQRTEPRKAGLTDGEERRIRASIGGSIASGKES